MNSLYFKMFSKFAKAFFCLNLLIASRLSCFDAIEVVNHPQIEYQGFKVVYDGRLKIPLYTYEYLTPGHLEKNGNRKLCCFKEDFHIAEIHRSHLKDYICSGYDKGHMVPAADQLFFQEALNETFYLSNICPQNSSLNR